MSYRIYIKKDYKPEVRWHPDPLLRRRYIPFLILFLTCVLTVLISSVRIEDESPRDDQVHLPSQSNITVTRNEESQPDRRETPILVQKLTLPALDPSESLLPPVPQTIPWQEITVKPGDSLSLIFDRLHLKPTILHQIIALGKDTRILTQLLPGNKLYFHVEDGNLLHLKYEPNLTTTLRVAKEGDSFTSSTVISELEKRVSEAEAEIDDSLFLAGQNAGLSDNLIMQLVAIYGWDIDFVLDIRKGDRFKLIYEERFKEGEKVSEGPILAAEFINQKQILKSVRYTSSNGDSDYFNEDGTSMRKAFLRTPLKFSRISSRFNPKRKHPVLNRIRAHRGVDYAAPTGTPVKATGDGMVTHAGNKGGFGKTVILKHGGNYNTLYAHLSKYANGIKSGKRVKQGQIIGYVGSTGLATGPHLHFEFRVNGVHRNPLTVKLPMAESIPKSELAQFRQQVAPLLAQLSKPVAEPIYALNNGQDHKLSIPD